MRSELLTENNSSYGYNAKFFGFGKRNVVLPIGYWNLGEFGRYGGQSFPTGS